jgi:hypothetical protein
VRRRATAARYTRLKAKEANELMLLVPGNREEAKQFKSILVFCDVKLKEARLKRRSMDSGPHHEATAACCHVIDRLAGPLWPPFQRILRKLRDEVLVSVYSDHVEPTGGAPYLQRVPYHALASQLRLELNDLEKEIFRLEGELAAAKSDRSEFEEMVLNARLAKLETEKELADYRQKMAEQEEEILRLKEDMSVATSERENAEDRTIRLSEQLQALEREVESHSGMKDQLEEYIGEMDALQTELSRRGDMIDMQKEEIEEFKVTLNDKEIREGMWQKQVGKLKDQIAELQHELSTRPAAGEHARPLTPRPAWETVGALAPELGDLTQKSSDENVQALAGYLIALGERIECDGDGPEVPAHLRFAGSVRRDRSSVLELRSRVGDMWRARTVQRQSGKGENDSFSDFAATYLAARWSDRRQAAQAGYNLHHDLLLHAGPDRTGHVAPDALCVLTYHVLGGRWAEAVYEDMLLMLKLLAALLGQLAPAKGEAVDPERRKVAASLEDFFPKDAKVVGDLVKALTADCPGVAIDLGKIFDGGASNGSEFVGKLCQIYVEDTVATGEAVDMALRETGKAQDGKISLAQAKDAIEAVGGCGGPGADAAGVAARAASQPVGKVAGKDGAKVEIAVLSYVPNLLKSGPLRTAELFDPNCKLSVGGASSQGNKPPMA